MSSNNEPKDVAAELAYQARHAAVAEPLEKNSPEKIERYRQCKNFRADRKEYTYKVIHELKPATVLDFGCGDGEICTQLALLGYQTTGFDISPEHIQRAKERAILDGVEDKVRFFVADGSDVTIENQTFDMVIVQLVLHHVDIPACLENVRKHVKPGGWVIIIEPVAYSTTLQWLRDRSPVEKDISPNERQLNLRDLAIIDKYFTIHRRQHFRLFGRLDRVLPKSLSRILYATDALLLRTGIFDHFAAVVVLTCQRPA